MAKREPRDSKYFRLSNLSIYKEKNRIKQMLKLEKIFKSFKTPEGELPILYDLNLDVMAGEFISIMGPSGSGKSTFLGIAAGLDKPDRGRVYIDGEEITSKQENQLGKVRSEKIGFIFQNFQLIKNLSAIENVSLPLLISGKYRDKEIKDRARELLKKVSLEARIHHLPSQLSGGEEQRVAIARAFINNPKLLFADEPTGNLDSRNGDLIMNMLLDLNRSMGSTLIIVTHDPGVADYSSRIMEMRDGVLSEKKMKIDVKPKQIHKSKKKVIPKKKK
jgi:putative ABC transport system ATP-binding protein